jgi:hypothetical protein
VEANTFLDLLRNAFDWIAIGWIECVIIAKSTSPFSLGPIPVWAGKTGIDT